MNYPQGGDGWQHVPPPQLYGGQPYPGQQYGAPPPPPKRDKNWPVILSVVVPVIVLAIGGVAAFAYYEWNRKVTFTYEVTGTGANALVYYSFNGGTVSEATELPLPWTKTFEGNRRSAFQLTANAPYGETVTCKVSIDGKLIVTKTEPSGPWAACTGQYYD